MLGLKDLQPSRRPGEKRAAVEKAAASEREKPPTAATREGDAQKRGGEFTRPQKKKQRLEHTCQSVCEWSL